MDVLARLRLAVAVDTPPSVVIINMIFLQLTKKVMNHSFLKCNRHNQLDNNLIIAGLII